MSDFIELLKNVGGVKPCHDTIWNKGTPMPEDYTCSCGIYVHPTRVNLGAVHTKDCPYRPVLDLAPLLANPRLLKLCAEGLWTDINELDANLEESESKEHFIKLVEQSYPNLHIVGPQRASNLVYEVTRQLGGTAVVAEPTTEMREIEQGLCEGLLELRITGYRLSIPIPPDATVLFVTDRVDNEKKYRLTNSIGGPSNHPYNEMQEIIHTVAGTATRPCLWKYLTYVLCLINSSGSDELEMPYGPHEGEWKVISLHKENR